MVTKNEKSLRHETLSIYNLQWRIVEIFAPSIPNFERLIFFPKNFEECIGIMKICIIRKYQFIHYRQLGEVLNTKLLRYTLYVVDLAKESGTNQMVMR